MLPLAADIVKMMLGDRLSFHRRRAFPEASEASIFRFRWDLASRLDSIARGIARGCSRNAEFNSSSLSSADLEVSFLEFFAMTEDKLQVRYSDVGEMRSAHQCNFRCKQAKKCA